jgi:hypothetical protein
MTPESAALRESIRQGLIAAHIDRGEWEWAVARVYELERNAERDITPCPRAPQASGLKLNVEMIEVRNESRKIHFGENDHTKGKL